MASYLTRNQVMVSFTPESMLYGLASAIGLFYITKFFVFNIITPLLSCFRSPNLKKYGPWAVVTGATDGIGKAYATQLAHRGLNVVLISRSSDRLATTAEEIKSKCPSVETKCITADFSESAESGLYDRIAEELAGLEVGILVNNVGMSYPSALYFHELDDHDSKRIDNLIAINVGATTQMTRIIVKDMVKRKRGAIINISSAAGRVPIGNPLYAVYSASKAYVDYLSRSMHYELKPFGVHVQCQSPYFVTSKLSKIRHASLTTPNPDTFAAAAVKAIGTGPSVVPFWSHAVQDFVIQSMPTFMLSSYLVSLHLAIRRKFLKKMEEKHD